MEERVSPKERLLPDTTTVIGMLWVGATIYERLWARAVPLNTPTVGWFATIITLVVAWSLMSRKRWARIALLGMAALAAGSALWSLANCFAFPGVQFLRHTIPPALASAIPGEGEHSATMATSFLVLSLITLGWLARTRVRSEFDTRKVKALHSYQIGIAAVLVLCWITSEVGANRWPDQAVQRASATAHVPPQFAISPAALRLAWHRQNRARVTD